MAFIILKSNTIMIWQFQGDVMKYVLSIVLALFLSESILAQTQNFVEAWKGFSDPEIFSSDFTHDFKSLPLEGSIQIGPKAWSGDFWASKRGGINLRWNHPSQEGFDYKSPTKEQVMSMDLSELATLSPTEKYDLFTGRYDYPLKKEVQGSVSRNAADWTGICHGWAPASIFHNEPTPKILTNPDGIQIPFGSSDIKALISYFYAFHHDNGTDQIGLRCFFGSWLGGARGCGEDLNAGAFHIVIANKIGLYKEGFLADVDRYREVWNQPLIAFKSVVVADNLPPSKSAAKNTVKEIKIATDIFYVNENLPGWNTVHGTRDQMISRRSLLYRIELNAQGKIIGGEWESKERPDFIWNKNPAKLEEFNGILSELPKLLND
jgi:Transglutaminase elicitor